MENLNFRLWRGVQGAKYYLVQTVPQLKHMCQEAKDAKSIAFDTETNGLNWVFSDVCGICIGFGLNHNYYIPIAHKTDEKQLDVATVVEHLKPIVENKKTKKLFWNAKFDLHGFRKLGLNFPLNTVVDVLLACFILDENEDHSLKYQSKKIIDSIADKWEKDVLNNRKALALKRRQEASAFIKGVKSYYKGVGALTTEEINEIANKKLKEEQPLLALNKLDDITYDYVPLDIITPYACADVHYTYSLFPHFFNLIKENEDLYNLFLQELDLMAALYESETHGLKVDKKFLEEVGPKLESELPVLEKKIYDLAGREFNINSSSQLEEVLLSSGIKLTKLTKTCQEKINNGEVIQKSYSTDSEVLEKLALKHALPRAILEYRDAFKSKSTYVDGIYNLLDDDNFVHSSFNQNVKTGRMSSRTPNFQNFPKFIRRAFVVPNEEYIYLLIDYSQVELRLTAHVSQDPKLLSCYPWEGKGTDVHTLTCSEAVAMMPIPQLKAMEGDKTGHIEGTNLCPCPNCFYEESRRRAKVVNFGIIYGAGPKGLSAQMSTPTRVISEKEAKELIDRYFKTYKGVQDFIRKTERYVERHGQVQHALGRIRHLPDAKSRDFRISSPAKRMAVNFLVQGLAADIFKKSYINVAQLLEGTKSKVVNAVHDEIQIYLHKEDKPLVPSIKKIMEDWKFSVPIVADVSYSDYDWASKKKYPLEVVNV